MFFAGAADGAANEVVGECTSAGVALGLVSHKQKNLKTNRGSELETLEKQLDLEGMGWALCVVFCEIRQLWTSEARLFGQEDIFLTTDQNQYKEAPKRNRQNRNFSSRECFLRVLKSLPSHAAYDSQRNPNPYLPAAQKFHSSTA